MENADEKLDRLFAAARAEQPDTSSRELYFEIRLMARIAEQKNRSAPWYLLAWRMIPGFAVVTLITIACSITFNPARSSDLFAGITAGQEDRLTISYLAGE